MPTPEHTLAAAEGASNAGGSGSSGAEGSKGPSVRLVPFQSMPQSTQEELGKDLFDDPLLTVDNMKKLADCMQIYQGESPATTCHRRVVICV